MGAWRGVKEAVDDGRPRIILCSLNGGNIFGVASSSDERVRRCSDERAPSVVLSTMRGPRSSHCTQQKPTLLFYFTHSHRVVGVGISVAKLDRVDLFIVIAVDVSPPAHAVLKALESKLVHIGHIDIEEEVVASARGGLEILRPSSREPMYHVNTPCSQARRSRYT